MLCLNKSEIIQQNDNFKIEYLIRPINTMLSKVQLSKVQLGPRYFFTLTFQLEHIPFIQGLDECLLLHSQVVFLAFVSTSFSGSKVGQWSGAANLTCTVVESVTSSNKLGL